MMDGPTQIINGLRRSNTWFEYDLEGRRRKPRESTKALYERCLRPMAGELRSILEIGVCEAASSLWIWQNIRPDLWVGVDPWFPDRRRHEELFRTYRENFWHNVAVSGAEDLLIPGPGGRISTRFRFGPTSCLMAEWPSQEYLAGVIQQQIAAGELPPQFDLCIVDGDHHGAEALTDMVLCWRVLKQGGILVIDDYERRWLHGKPHVKEAAHAFFQAFEDRLEKLLECKRQLWLRKLSAV